jgi:hypothetical protein
MSSGEKGIINLTAKDKEYEEPKIYPISVVSEYLSLYGPDERTQ